MRSSAIQRIRPLVLDSLFFLREKFLFAPTPPPQLATCIWGDASKEISGKIPNIVWLYWHTGDIPIVCQQCIKRIERLNPSFVVHVLNADNIRNFLPELASIDLATKDIPIANYSDLIRLMLLEKYGGFWLDVSIILNIKLDYFTKLSKAKQVELVLFTKPENGYTKYSISNLERPLTETWFLGAVKGSKFIKDWKDEFINCLASPVPSDYYKSDESYPSYVKGLPASLWEYLLVYISSQSIMHRKKGDYKLLFLNAFETGFLYPKSCFWNNELTAQLLTKVKKAKLLPLMIKLTNDTRRITEEAIRDKSYTQDSLLSTLLAE